MAFHSLKNQTLRKRERRGTVIKGVKKRSGSKRHRDIGEVQIKNEKRKSRRDRTRGEERVMEVDHTRDTGRYVCPDEFFLQFGKTAPLMAQGFQGLLGLCSVRNYQNI